MLLHVIFISFLINDFSDSFYIFKPSITFFFLTGTEFFVIVFDGLTRNFPGIYTVVIYVHFKSI